MDIFHQLFSQDKHIQVVLEQIKAGAADHQLITGLTGGARPAFLQALYRETNQPIYLVTSNLLQGQKLVDDLSALLGDEAVHFYPADEFIASSMTLTSPELRSARIATLDRLAQGEKGVYVIPVAALRKMMPTPTNWRAQFLQAEVGDEIDLETWLSHLVKMGYTRSQMVTTPGEFAARGGILDIYPTYMEAPIRLELFDTEVDYIRMFSADDQRSIEKLQEVRILPATEIPLSVEERLVIAERIEEALSTSLKKVKNVTTQELLLQHTKQDIEILREGHLPDHVAKYSSLLFEEPAFLGDYFAREGLVIFDELGRIQEVMEAWEREEQEWFLSLIEEGKMLHDVKPSYALKEVLAMTKQQKLFFALFARTFAGVRFQKTTNFSCKPMQQFHGQIALLQNELERWQLEKFTVLFTAYGQERLNTLQTMLADYEIHTTIGAPSGSGVYLIDAALSKGFELPLQKIAVVTDDELFKQQAKKKKSRPQTMSNAERIKS